MVIDMKVRPYLMTTRAEQVAQTREAIIGAAVSLAGEVTLSRITLQSIAERAGVSVQTVLRQFGTRDALFDAAIEHVLPEVLAERPTDPDDIPASIDALIAHYELRGDSTLLLLGQESWDPIAKRATDVGKAGHRTWVTATWRHALGAAPEAERETITDLLALATDLYAWKLWRRDRRLTRRETTDRMLRLTASVIAGAAAHGDTAVQP